MRFKTVLAMGLLLACMLAARAGDEARDLKALEGTWVAELVSYDGKEVSGEKAHKVTLTIKDGTYVYDLGKDVIRGRLVLDASKNPKTVDAVRTEGDKKGSSLQGIYELSGTTFKVCFAAPGMERPTAFSAKEGSGNRLTVWKRSK